MCINTVRPRQNGRHFAADIFKCIFLNDIYFILMPRGPISSDPALVQIMAWRWTGAKSSSAPKAAPGTDAYMQHSASMS